MYNSLTSPTKILKFCGRTWMLKIFAGDCELQKILRAKMRFFTKKCYFPRMRNLCPSRQAKVDKNLKDDFCKNWPLVNHHRYLFPKVFHLVWKLVFPLYLTILVKKTKKFRLISIFDICTVLSVTFFIVFLGSSYKYVDILKTIKARALILDIL
jgi:hypothetical protein